MTIIIHHTQPVIITLQVPNPNLPQPTHHPSLCTGVIFTHIGLFS
jgi:hypothetical protein